MSLDVLTWISQSPFLPWLIAKVWVAQNDIAQALLSWATDYDTITAGFKTIRDLIRFRGLNLWHVDTVGIHQLRMHSLVIHLGNYLRRKEKRFDMQYALAYAYNHDNVEPISFLGDIPGPLKDTLTPEEKQLLDDIEGALIDVLTEHVILASHDHAQILRDAIHKPRIENKVIGYLDKVDGFMQTLHELFAGNTEFLEPFNNYIKYFKKAEQQEALQSFFTSRKTYWITSFFDIQTLLWLEWKIEDLMMQSRAHDVSNLLDDWGIPAYLCRKRVFLGLAPILPNHRYEKTPVEMLSTRL